MASLPRATYYFELSKSDKDIKNKEIMDLIQNIFYENKQRYGFKRITAELRNRGYLINHKKVLRLMTKMGLRAVRRKEKYHSYLGEIGHIADNLINRNFIASKPNEKWTTDVSQFNCAFGKVYLSPIIDMGMGDVVSWDLSLSPNLEQTIRMLDKAFIKYPHLDGLIFHSDMGWQYQHNCYQKRLKEKGIIQSMSRKGNCIDNCIMESFFGVMKNEMFYGHESEFKNLINSKRRLLNILIITTTKELRAKQNGCLHLSLGKHPC